MCVYNRGQKTKLKIAEKRRNQVKHFKVKLIEFFVWSCFCLLSSEKVFKDIAPALAWNLDFFVTHKALMG